MATATNLMVHAGGIRRSLEELRGLHTPAPTATWTPIAHAELVGQVQEGLRAVGCSIINQEYATAAKDARLFGVMDLMAPAYNEAGGVGLALGLRASNDKSLAIRIIAAARIFICDNLAFSGGGEKGSVCLHVKHSGKLRLDRHVPKAIDLFLDKAGVWRADLERMREVEISDGRAKELIFDAFAASKYGDRVLPGNRFGDVARLYFNDDEQRIKFPDRTLWSLNNTFTEAVKLLRPSVQMQYGERIGRYFARELARACPPPAVRDVVDFGANAVIQEGVNSGYMGGGRAVDVELVEEDGDDAGPPLGGDGAMEGRTPGADPAEPRAFEVRAGGFVPVELPAPVAEPEQVPEPWEEVWGRMP